MPPYFDEAWATLKGMAETVVARLPLVAVALVVFFAFFFAARGVRHIVRRVATERRRHRNVGLVLGRITQGLMVLLGVLIGLIIIFPSFQFADLIAVLGLGSVAIGFAFRDILGNFLAGILLLLTEPFKIGDQIIVGDYEGTVRDIQTRATIIRTYDGRRVVIPNEKLFTESVTVNTARETRRSQYDVGIGVSDDIGRARKLILEAVRKVEGILPEPAPEALVLELADFSVKLRVFWWTRPPQQIHMLRTTDAVLQAIKETLISNGIDLPYPTQQVLLHDQTEETDGDRARQREGWPAGGDDQSPRPARIGQAIRLAARRLAKVDHAAGREGKDSRAPTDAQDPAPATKRNIANADAPGRGRDSNDTYRPPPSSQAPAPRADAR